MLFKKEFLVHFPVSLDLGKIQGSRRHFKFDNMWLRYEGFADRIRQQWSSCQLGAT